MDLHPGELGMKAVDYLAGAGQRDLREHNERAGYVIIGALLTWLAVTQTVAIHSTQNGLSSLDPYDEADGIRAAEYYARYGFLKDAGLPHIGYGDRFPSAGWVGDAAGPLCLQEYIPTGRHCRI